MKMNLTPVLAIFILLAISCTKESVNKISSPQLPESLQEPSSFKIGQHYGGGVIFYIDNTGQHGLISDTADLNPATWWNGTNMLTGAIKIKVGTGKGNTNKIIAAEGKPGHYAALECARSTRSGYTDWYLPSKDELDSMFSNRKKIGGFTTSQYWCSTEYGNWEIWSQSFERGKQGTIDAYYVFNVRAIRAF